MTDNLIFLSVYVLTSNLTSENEINEKLLSKQVGLLKSLSNIILHIIYLYYRLYYTLFDIDNMKLNNLKTIFTLLQLSFLTHTFTITMNAIYLFEECLAQNSELLERRIRSIS